MRMLLAMIAVFCLSAAQSAEETAGRAFDPEKDLLSLHYDHAPDRDDGHSAAADRSLLETLYGAAWLQAHVLAVSGAYGTNAHAFNPQSDAVMDAVWKERGGWLAAHTQRDQALATMTRRWAETLAAGGDVWVKEGGQSDLTAEVVRRLRKQFPDLDTTRRIHVVQHSTWNEKSCTAAELAYTREATNYVRIKDANRYLNVTGGDQTFQEAALKHPVFGPGWKAAFAYYAPQKRLDFSDTGELMHILGLGELGIDAFRERFLAPPAPTGTAD